ncbi:MAG: universal stress protein [Armatimonadota bacterium]|nr:universal stress protein [Armatimonadota bacterium]MDR7519071.1 universal stress protein [Armatimonadota bacterium]MDR7550226.1 universal stress protein [Armatimonadota bacterium]
MRVLVALDLSPTSAALAEFAVRLAHQSGGALTALHAYTADEATRAWREAGLHLDRFIDHLRAEMAYLLARTGVEAGRVKVVVVQGDPAEAILEQASAGADLIVVGTHGRTGLPRLLMGSVAEAVVRRAPCPVVVVPYAILARRVDDFVARANA